MHLPLVFDQVKQVLATPSYYPAFIRNVLRDFSWSWGPRRGPVPNSMSIIILRCLIQNKPSKSFSEDDVSKNQPCPPSTSSTAAHEGMPPRQPSAKRPSLSPSAKATLTSPWASVAPLDSFEITFKAQAEGEAFLVYSKLEKGKFPEADELVLVLQKCNAGESSVRRPPPAASCRRHDGNVLISYYYYSVQVVVSHRPFL